ncbi:MAG: CPBP family intramembrane metalloprotease [Terracidiphilus sp.]|nr:CPBP family intramembrane metalloprotease [Terracidiphilus sp.]
MADETPEEMTTPEHAEAEQPRRDLAWVLLNDEGLRPGWAVALFAGLLYVIMVVLDMVAVSVMPSLAGNQPGPRTMAVAEAVMAAAMAGAAMVLARAQQRGARDYHWLGPRAARRFAEGLAAGFVALSALVGLLAAGGWLRFGRAEPDAAQVAKYGAVWAAAFLLTALFEEGTFRCSLLGALERGLRFKWALATVVAICAVVTLRSHGHGAVGVAAAALLGLGPCAWLARRGESGFWQAAWVTSVAFGAVHTGNGGETAVGIFAATLIGFVFALSVRVTGSAWWAIGCHAAWDWAETFFYGTADSGFAARGHLLTTTTAGSAVWSGGAVGPEGSVLAAPVALAMAAAVWAVYGRKR